MFVKTHASKLFDGRLEVKLPTYGQMQQPLWEESERERVREESQQQEDASARKGRKVPKHCVLTIGRSRSRLAKAAGAEPSGGMRDQKLHAAVARSTFFPKQSGHTEGFLRRC